MLDANKKQQIMEILQQKRATNPCERCSKQNFTLLDGYFRQDVQTDLATMNLGGPNIPTIAMACDNCGNISSFAVKALLPNEY
jgi:hypothetical protein